MSYPKKSASELFKYFFKHPMVQQIKVFKNLNLKLIQFH